MGGGGAGDSIAGPYEVVDLRYGSGQPAVQRHTDGSGFAYYPSGRRAVCVTSSGRDMKGMARRFSVAIYEDDERGSMVGSFDEWGRGEAPLPKSAEGGGLKKAAPRWLIMEESMVSTDGKGVDTMIQVQHGKVAGPETSLKLNNQLTLRRGGGKGLFLDFMADRVSHSFAIGALNGELPPDLTATLPRGERLGASLGSTMQQLKELTSNISDPNNGTLKVDPFLNRTKHSRSADPPTLESVLATLNSLKESPFLNATEPVLKKKLGTKHPLMQRAKTICKWSGKYTDEGAAQLPPCVKTPQTLKEVSQAHVLELVDQLSGRGTLLVVVCLASYADQSAFARRLAEACCAEFAEKHAKSAGGLGDPAAAPVQFVAVEMSECRALANKYEIKEVPYCLMFQGGAKVYGQKMGGMKEALRYPDIARPRVLLLEPQCKNQLRSERAVKRNGLSWDLAISPSDAQRMAAGESYGLLIASTEVSLEEIRNVFAAVRRNRDDAIMFLVHDPTTTPPAEGDDFAKKAVKDDTAHLFSRPLGKMALESALAKYGSFKPRYMSAGTTKEDFVKEIERTLEGRTKTG